ncbi:MAG: penicillin-binding transpeptidase domain-containing protein [Gemmatimonadaceae bacterium]
MRINRVTLIHAALAVFAVALVAQAARVQIFQGDQWAARARRQQFARGGSRASRGNVFDASGNVLVESRELYRLAVAPNELKNRPAFVAGMTAAGFPKEWIVAASDTRRKWVPLPGLHVASEVSLLTPLAGVHTQSVMNRDYVSSAGIRRILGGVDASGKAANGIELSMDGILSGDTVRASFARDVKGRRMDTPGESAVEPRAGNNVTLTINRDLQDICEGALKAATDSLQATGGDIVVMNPRTGDILAMASQRSGQSFSNTAVTEPFEPGSTIKPFMAAALLERGKARTDEMIDTHGGEWTFMGRTITDSHREKEMSLADVIRFSSNIGIVQFTQRLTRREQYETLRDLGLGTPTGVPLPSEAAGTLREPSRWNATSVGSIAMGYEIAVTPLQLVAAYASLANGGALMEPHLIKEIRAPDGEVLFQAKPRVLRQVFRSEVASKVRQLMISVVDSGTGIKADLATFRLAGKSGTARRTMKGRGYVEGNYTASFVGLFPADDPQFVVLVKLDSPRGGYYGGDIAAPVSAVVLRAAIAARDAALDRGELAVVERRIALPESSNLAARTAAAAKGQRPTFAPALDMRNGDEAVPVPLAIAVQKPDKPPAEFSLPFSRPRIVADVTAREVPDVTGLTLRNAVRALHRAGFRVQLVNSIGASTSPAPGTMLTPGSIVKLQQFH